MLMCSSAVMSPDISVRTVATRGLNGDVCQGAIVHTLRVEIGGRSKAKQLTEANTTVQLPRKSYVRTRD